MDKKEYMKKWREDHKEDIKKSRRIYNETHKNEREIYLKENEVRIKELANERRLKRKDEIKAQNKVYKKEHAEEIREKRRIYNQKRSELMKERYRQNRESIRLKVMNRSYGVDETWMASKLQEQNNKCAICKSDDIGGRWGKLCIDHCHKTSKTRGLLCSKCNTAIGLLLDDVNILESAKQYLLKYNS